MEIEVLHIGLDAHIKWRIIGEDDWNEVVVPIYRMPQRLKDIGEEALQLLGP